MSGISAMAAVERAGAAAPVLRRPRARLAWVLGLVIAALPLFACYLLAHLRGGQSETPAAPKDR